MTRLDWNLPGQRVYETGVDRGVLYPRLGDGVAWPGLVSVSEQVDGGDITPYHYDGVKYIDVAAAEDFSATLEAFAAPPEFFRAEGQRQLVPGLIATHQPKETFGLSYRTLIGNDLQGLGFGYKLHLVYGCTSAPSNRNYSTVASDPDVNTRSWDISTVPPPASTYRPTAHFIFDTRYAGVGVVETIEDALYGTAGTAPRLPSQDEIFAMAGG